MKKKYLIYKNAISTELCRFLCEYSMIKATALTELLNNNLISIYDQRFGTFGDEQIPNSKTFCIYGDAAFDTLLLKLQSLIEKKTKNKLIPTYSYLRIYQKGDKLEKHTDRNECEFSITLNLGGDMWPIFIENKKINLNAGDLLIYKGCEAIHWREEFTENRCFQVFLHYKNMYKKEDSSLFDSRVALGISKNIPLKN